VAKKNLSAGFDMIDVLGLGILAVDELLFVQTYPRPDTKTPIVRHERQCGGLTGTALVAAARLGAGAAYAGLIGDDELSLFVEEAMSREGVDFTHAVRRGDASPAHSYIIVDQTNKTRTILFEMKGVAGAANDQPDEWIIRSSRVLLVDHSGMEGVVRAARIARESGISVVADFERRESPLFNEALALVDHLVIPREFALALTGASAVTEAVGMLWNDSRQAVVVTCGADGSWYLAPDISEPQHCPAFQVPVVDTTGCGDVFHGAYASALVSGMEVAERVRFASAAAAMKAMRPGGQAGIPTREEVEKFLRERSLHK
jgi:sugar/nucleoside kinase (ribokinase family)